MNLDTMNHIRYVAEQASRLISRNRATLKGVKEFLAYQTSNGESAIQKFDSEKATAVFAPHFKARTKQAFKALCDATFAEYEEKVAQGVAQVKEAHFIKPAAQEAAKPQAKTYAVNIPKAGSLTEAKVEFRRALVCYEYAETRLDNAADAPAQTQEKLLSEFEEAFEELERQTVTLIARARDAVKSNDPLVENLFNVALDAGFIPPDIKKRLINWCLKVEA